MKNSKSSWSTNLANFMPYETAHWPICVAHLASPAHDVQVLAYIFFLSGLQYGFFCPLTQIKLITVLSFFLNWVAAATSI